MKDMLYAIVAIVSLGIAAFSFYEYTQPGGGNSLYLAAVIVFVLVALVLGGLFLSGRVNKNEDIHITE